MKLIKKIDGEMKKKSLLMIINEFWWWVINLGTRAFTENNLKITKKKYYIIVLANCNNYSKRKNKITWKQLKYLKYVLTSYNLRAPGEEFIYSQKV